MKIGYFAHGPWAHQAFDRIIADKSMQIVFVVSRYDMPDQVLEKKCNEYNIPYLLYKNINEANVIAELVAYEADIFVSMSFNQIIKANLLAVPRLGFINCHAGALRKYRGRNILNWALINGEQEVGVTVHYIDEGIDTGDIILQEFLPIGPDEGYGSLLRRACVLCADILYRSLVQLVAGTADRIKQAGVGFYCGRRAIGDEWIDWSWPSDRIHNFIRAITLPGPGARTIVRGEILVIVSSQRVENAPSYFGKSGELVGRDSQGVLVKTGDSTIRILQVAKIEDGDIGEPFLPKYPIGTFFGVNMLDLYHQQALRQK